MMMLVMVIIVVVATSYAGLCCELLRGLILLAVLGMAPP